MTRIPLKIIYLLFCFVGLMACSVESNDKSIATQEPTDYSVAENWLKLGVDSNYNVDVFYLYPTSWKPTESDGLYCELDNASLRETAPVVYQNQAKVFEEIANVYVPWYRQVDAMKTLGKTTEEVDSILKVIPYQDALAAFEFYLQHYNKNKPFILASHSQGSSVLKLLLQDYMKQHPDVLSRMVAAYTLGFSFENSYFDKNKHLKFAKGETDTGVIISWNCERKENGEFGTFNNVCYPGALSINPVNWQHNDKATAADDERFLESNKYPDLTCTTRVEYDEKRGYEVLILGISTNEYDMDFIGDKSLHGLDFSLFTENIKENALKRIEAFGR